MTLEPEGSRVADARPTLLYLHGVGDGDPQNRWRTALQATLADVGYPDLSGVNVIAPKYSRGLFGVDDEVPLPKVTVRPLRGANADQYRLEFQRRRTAMESRLGRDEQGVEVFGVAKAMPVAANQRSFVQAKNYVEMTSVRSWVLQRILSKLPESGQLVIVGHSLGSVIAADLLRRLPAELEVAGMITIGSPLAHEMFDVDELRANLTDPPPRLAWWVNFWNVLDPVPAHRGVSSAIRWVLDQRIAPPRELSWRAPEQLHPVRNHEAATYLSDTRVATAIGYGLFGSLSREIVRVEKGVDIALDFSETLALLGLRFAHLSMQQLERGDVRTRYHEALRQTQALAFEQIKARNNAEDRLMPESVANLAVDLSSPDSSIPEPRTPAHLTMSDALVMLIAIATTNVMRPFEIEVPKDTGLRAMEQLTLEMGLGSRVGAEVFAAVDEARRVLKGPTNWLKWMALGLGAAAMIAVTGGLALAAAPGVAGAAAITSALAAFGPGGMIGGLLTAGTLVTAGGGGIALGLAAPGTSAATVEAVVGAQLTTALLRKSRSLEQDPQTWASLTELEMQVSKEYSRLEAVSDQSAPSLKELQRKLDAINLALKYLQEHDLGPGAPQLMPGHS